MNPYHMQSDLGPYCLQDRLSIQTDERVDGICHEWGKRVKIKSENAILYMGLDARKPVFWVSDKVVFKPSCSATEPC